MATSDQFTNALVNETSPYLLQHAHNPVDWNPWCPEALERARRKEKPIFLSIGYSACHWCHVMEHESFEDPATAAIMNEHFINIKVDREERPDLDQIYMTAVQLMTQHGGWPMSVFLTPDLEPFYGGTYFPPQPRFGMPSFQQILQGVADAWRNRRGEVARSAGQLAGALAQMNQLTPRGAGLSLELVGGAVRHLERVFDPGHGGFGSAPKFPHPMDIRVCLRHWKRTGSTESLNMVTVTLDHMARGGIYDHLGGGFHRYSTDERWLVPHFEKMLYDNALLTQVYLEAYQATHNSDFARVARETLDYVLREMTSSEGGFYSTQDADSEGVEGKYFVWSLQEVTQLLDPKAAELFCYCYDVTAEGNWEGNNILNSPKTPDQCARLLRLDPTVLEQSLAQSRAKLLAARSHRVPPGRDDKVLISWNGLMIDAMARGYQVLGDARYLEAARRAAEFIFTRIWKVATDERAGGQGSGARGQESGGSGEPVQQFNSSTVKPLLRHSYKDGRARFNAYLDDYAILIDSLVTLYEADFDVTWLVAALELAGVMVDQFWDEAGGSFLYTGRDHETLLTRTRDAHDSATPSGNSMAVTGLLRLGRLTGRTDLVAKAECTLQSFSGLMAESPMATGQMLVALEFLVDRPIEVVLVPGESTEETSQALRALRDRFLPNQVVASFPLSGPSDETQTDAERPVTTHHSPPEGIVPLLADKKAADGKTTVYICENFTCQTPLVSLEELREALEELGAGHPKGT